MKSIKNSLLTASISFISFYSFGWAELCPEGVESGGDGCYMVEEVLHQGEWLKVCCANIKVPEGFKCVKDDCDANKATGTASLPELTRRNAYVRFTQGYSTWTIVNGMADPYGSGIDMKTMRTYLPFARQIFLINDEFEMFSVIHSDEITIIIQRPEDESELMNEIIFPPPMPTGKEIERFFYKMYEEQLKIFPNPASRGTITIFFENKKLISRISIFSQEGELVNSTGFGKEGILKVEISIKDLKPALYILKVSDRFGREFSREFIKEA